MQMYGNFEGFPDLRIHCLGWCHIMTPGLSSHLGGSFYVG